MPKACTKPLKQQPFQTYRDPETGRWYVVRTPTPIQTLSSTLEQPQDQKAG
ncbi:hypothetical protein [Leptothoe sp. PORK10 BA2]|uniref:hypothetical protein n=1 Tax=Leptothoe sp. PORK10 BA2 TaxID=3110254 RepID=UPI002B1F8DB2|nr:hypothetical protein [Leptothoe sp. PORK10 BA2]MEA5462619.1 hypothetical protein [Leptothoe sp. PORK10 BA2]